MADDVLLQVAMEPELRADIIAESTRLNMTIRAFVCEVFHEALPRWRKAEPARPKSRASV